MAVNKVVFDGETIIDLTEDTVTEETLAEGVTAHNAAGEAIVGTYAASGSAYDGINVIFVCLQGEVISASIGDEMVALSDLEGMLADYAYNGKGIAATLCDLDLDDMFALTYYAEVDSGMITFVTDHTITPARVISVNADGTVSYDEYFMEYARAMERVATASSADGISYTATLNGITELSAGLQITIIPSVVSASTAPTLNVNGLGAKTIKRRLSSNATSLQAGYSASWLAAGAPFTLLYDGTYWIVEGQDKPNASDLSGTLPISKGGTGATTAAAARSALGAVSSSEVSTLISNALAGTAAGLKVAYGTVSVDYPGTVTVSLDGFSTIPVVVAIGSTYSYKITNVTTGYHPIDVSIRTVSKSSVTFYAEVNTGGSDGTGTIYYIAIGS